MSNTNPETPTTPRWQREAKNPHQAVKMMQADALGEARKTAPTDPTESDPNLLMSTAGRVSEGLRQDPAFDRQPVGLAQRFQQEIRRQSKERDDFEKSARAAQRVETPENVLRLQEIEALDPEVRQQFLEDLDARESQRIIASAQEHDSMSADEVTDWNAEDDEEENFFDSDDQGEVL
jgi:hypothetical protein